jgi:hypothetical protein
MLLGSTYHPATVTLSYGGSQRSRLDNRLWDDGVTRRSQDLDKILRPHNQLTTTREAAIRTRSF